MPFNSITFVVFFIFVYIVYRQLPRLHQNIFLLTASYVFYGWWDIRFLFLIILSTVLDYACGIMITDGSIPRRQRAQLSSLIVLGAFFLIVVQWRELGAGISSLAITWPHLFSWKTGWIIFALTTFIVFTANLLYGVLTRIDIQKKRKLFLILSIAGNLSILCLFKYFNFFLENFESFVRVIGWDPARFRLHVVLPVGISFYTFMTMSYTIDVYRGTLKPAKKIHEYALFVAFFPKLLAGPIERATHFLPQISEERDICAHHTLHGMQQIVTGLFKKIVIADGVAKTVSSLFDTAFHMTWADAAVGMLLFTFQIYCDFSGYSDIATGTARLLGFDLMRNFNFPYLSRNPSEFWARWHISLSSWFRDYVFFPLGGPYGTTLRWMRNVLLTFFVTGLWHGAAWTYVVWGLYFGVLLCFYRLKEQWRGEKKRSKNPIRKAQSIVLFFLLTNFGWVLFRSHSLKQSWGIFTVLVRDFGNLKLNVEMPTYAAILGIPVLIVLEIIGNRRRGRPWEEVLPLPIWTAVYAIMVFLIILGLANVPTGFIYFVF